MAASKSAAPCRPPVLSNTVCSARSRSGSATTAAASIVTSSAATSYDDTVSTASIDALPQSPHELVV